jgi:hypothetical protein
MNCNITTVVRCLMVNGTGQWLRQYALTFNLTGIHKLPLPDLTDCGSSSGTCRGCEAWFNEEGGGVPFCANLGFMLNKVLIS